MTDFQNVNFDDGAVDLDRLQALANNDRNLKENLIPIKYERSGLVKVGGMKIASGTVLVPPTSKVNLVIDIFFGAFFTPGSRPVCNVTYNTHDYRQRRVFTTIQGIGSGVLDPDHTGMKVVIYSDPKAPTNNYFPASSRIHWTAIGY